MTVYRHLYDGNLEGVRLRGKGSGRLIRIWEDSVIKFLSAGEIKPGEEIMEEEED